MNIALLFLGALIFVFYYIIHYHDTTKWCCFFIFVAGFGAYYNEMYRFGDVMMSDIALLLFFMSYLPKSMIKKSRHMKSFDVFVIVIFCFELLLGIACGYSFSNILRDVKQFLYFFVTACYVRSLPIKDYRRFFKVIIYVGIFTLVSNIYIFFTYSINGLSTGKIDRIFWAGLGNYFLADLSLICFILNNKIKGKIFNLVYWLVQPLLVFAICVSYTRTVWIEFILIYSIFFAVYIPKYISKIVINKIVRITLLAVFIIFAVSSFLTSDNQISEVIVSKANSIYSGLTDKNDTLAYRFEDIYAAKYKYKNLQVIIGYGFGDTIRGLTSYEGTKTENSFLYYSWKYGVIFFFVYMMYLCKKLWQIFRRNDPLNQGIAIILTVSFLIGSMSGNLNKYYSLPMIAVALYIDFTKITN